MVHQLTKFHVQRVDMVINPPWSLPFLGAKGLTSPEKTTTSKGSSKMKNSDNSYLRDIFGDILGKDMHYLLTHPRLWTNTYDKNADEVPDKRDDDVSQRNGQEKEGGASNKEDDQHVQDFRAKLDSLLIQQKKGYANSTNRDSTASPSISTAEPSINTASENINTSSPNINTASPIPNDLSMQSLENTDIFDDASDAKKVGAEADLNNLETTKNVWTLVDLPKGKRAIGNKWVYRNKKDERGIVVRNKARLIDVKSAFLYGTIEEEVYVYQPPGFEDPQFPDKVYKIEKALYGLYQAPRAWYETLSTYLLENKFRKGTIDKTIFIKKDKGDIMLVQDCKYNRRRMESSLDKTKYVADILKKFDFVTVKTTSTPIETNKALLKDEEANDVDVHLYRSMIRSLMYLTASKPDIIYLKGQPKLGLWYPRDSPFNLEAFSDSDYAGASLDRKSTIGAEYVDATNCCGQVLWIQNQMLDYGFNFMNTKIYIDNESTICIVKNLKFHAKTKHIEIRHHFIRDSYEKRLLQVIKSRMDERACNIKQKCMMSQTPRQIKRGRDTKIPQSSGPPEKVGDEAIHKELGDRMERAATTASSLEVE
ncbi:putative ribonuclease H-like domain-containing protein [Tanacetum coccineum]